MVGVRYSARGPWASAVRGLDTFMAGGSDIRLPDVRLFAEPSAVPTDRDIAGNGRAGSGGGCTVGRATRDTAAA